MITSPNHLKILFGRAPMEKLVIDVTPCSTTLSTPIPEDGRVDSYFDSDSGMSSKTSTEHDSPTHLVVTDIADTMKAICTTREPQELTLAGEDALLDHLHHNAVTLSDVEALVPVRSRNFKVFKKLATNIGLYHSRKCINNQELEQMLIHIMTHDDYQYSLFQRTKSQIERFQRETKVWDAGNLTERQRQNKMQRIEARRQEQAKKAEREAQHRRNSVPARYRKPSQTSFLPFGCSSIADLITEIDGMSLSQALTIIENNGEVVPSESAKKAMMKKGIFCQTPKMVKRDGFWAQTRLHNGPGLQKKHNPKVGLPSRDVERRVVVTVPEDVLLKKTKKEQRDWFWSKSKSSPELLFSKKECEGVAVRLPPS